MDVTNCSTLLRGCEALALICQGHRRFGDLRRSLGLPATTLSRLLKDLVAGGWVFAAADGYEPGPRVSELSPRPDPIARLTAAADALLGDLRDRIRQTCLLVVDEGPRMRTVAKALHEEGMGMQEVGAIREDLLAYPWGWLFIDGGNAHPQRSDPATAPRPVQRRFRQGMAHFREAGFTRLEDGQVGKYAVPVYDRTGSVIAALGCGIFAADAADRERVAAAMRDTADRFQALIPKEH